MPVDKYFFSLTCCNAEGWVPIKTICTFKRMREFQEYGVSFIAYAVRRAIAQDGPHPLLAVSEDGTNVSNTVKVPVLDTTLPEYQEYLPAGSTPAPTSASPSPSESEEAAGGDGH